MTTECYTSHLVLDLDSGPLLLSFRADPESGLGGSGTVRQRQRLRLRKTFEAQGQQAARGKEGALHCAGWLVIIDTHSSSSEQHVNNIPDYYKNTQVPSRSDNSHNNRPAETPRTLLHNSAH